jgi:hypothetical protein
MSFKVIGFLKNAEIIKLSKINYDKYLRFWVNDDII